MNEKESKLLLVDRDEISECELQLSSDQYQAILEDLKVAITFADEQGRLISWNKCAQSLLGMNSQDLYLKPVKSLYPQEEWEKIKAFSPRQNSIQQHIETRMIKNDGGTIHIDILLNEVKNYEGKAAGSMAVFREITFNNLLEEVTRKSKSTRLDLVSIISHELCTPLTAIKEGIAIVLDGLVGKVNKDQKESLDIAKRNIDRLNRTIAELLGLVNIEFDELDVSEQLIDINEVIRDIHKLILPSLEGSKIDFNLKLADNLPRIGFDRDKIDQVLKTLIDNVIKFTEKGSITITTQQRKDVVQISVLDTACGISTKDLPGEFVNLEQLKKGSQTEKARTSLGLILSEEIIEKYKGKLYQESQDGKGTAFHIELPIEAAFTQKDIK